MSSHRSNSSAAFLAASVAAAVTVLIAGCGKSDSDSGAAPYGAPASPSGAPSTTASPSAAPSVTAVPPENVGPDTPTPSSFPSSAPSGTDKGADVTAPAIPTAGGAAGAPLMGMGGSPTAPLTATPELDAKIAAAEKSGNKAGIGAAYAERGTYRMNDPDAGARVKYRAALQDYRKALAADPTNAEAKHNKDLIESIYKEMGRPIPE